GRGAPRRRAELLRRPALRLRPPARGVRGAGAGAGPVRGGAAPGAGGALRTRPGAAEAREGHPAGALGRLAGVQGTAAARPRTQPGRLPGESSGRLPRRRGPAAAGPARAVPVGLPEPPVEPHAGPLAGAALPSRATDLGRVALRRPADAPRTRYG